MDPEAKGAFEVTFLFKIIENGKEALLKPFCPGPLEVCQ